MESLKPNDVAFLYLRNEALYATHVAVMENWVGMSCLTWVPCEAGETMKWKDTQVMRDEISGFRTATKEEVKRVIDDVRQLKYLGRFVVVEDGRKYFGRLSKAYRGGIELDPHMHIDCDGPRIMERPIYLSLDMRKPGVTIEEISEEEFKRVQVVEKEEWERLRERERQLEKK